MITTKQISLTSIISEKSRAYIDGTKLAGGTTIEDMKVNYQIANALRKIRLGGISFSEVKVELIDLMEDVKGFRFKKGDKEIFLNWTKHKKVLSNVIFNGGVDKFSNEDILQSIILLEMAEQLTDADTATLTEQLFTSNEIKKDSPEALTLAKVVTKIEESILNGVLAINKFTDDEYDIIAEKPLLENELDTSSFSATGAVKAPVVEEVHEEKNSPTEIQPEEKKVDKATSNGGLSISVNGEKKETLQYTLFGDMNEGTEAVVTFIKDKEPNKAVRNAANENKVTKLEKPKLTKEQALAMRPDVSDHNAAEEKLRTFDLPEKFIKQCMNFRELQLKELTAEEILLIPNETYYTGWTDPIKRGIAAFLVGKNLFIRGETSTGKSTLVKTICSLLNYPMTFVGGSMDATLETFIGINTLEDGNVGVKNAPLIEAMIKGAIFYLDEGNSVLPGIFIQLHSAMDRQRTIYNQLTGEKIVAHKNFRVVTCVNDGYAGTNELNPATLDRFVAIETKYMKPEDAKKYYENFPIKYTEFQKNVLKLGDFSEDEILELLEIQNAIQQGVMNGTLDGYVASQRNFEAILELSCMLEVKEAVLMVIQKYPKEQRAPIATVFSEVEALNMTVEELLEI